MKAKSILFITIYVLGIHGISFSQVRLQRELTTLAGLTFETWKAKEDKISQLAIPLTVIYPITDKARLDLMTSPAFNTLNTGTKLNGLSDVKLSGHYLTGNDKLLVTFGLNLPTGKSSLTTEEFSVSNVLSIHAFNFTVPNMGQGLDLNVGLATATEVGHFVVGGGISYFLKGTFKPFKDYGYKYNPGDEITLSVGLDRVTELFGNETRITGDVVYTIYGNDQGNGEKIFKSGNRLMLQSIAYVQTGSFDLILSIRERMKARNKTGIGDVFKEERKNSNGNEFEVAGQGIYPYAENLRLSGLLELKLYGNNEYDTGGATLIGLGGGVQYRFSEHLMVDANLKFYFGNIKSTEERTTLTGFKLNGGIKYYF